LGPTYDYLKNKKGLTDAQIIKSSSSSNGGDLDFTKPELSWRNYIDE